MEEENTIYLLRDRISLAIQEAGLLLNLAEFENDVSLKSYDEALMEYEEFAPDLIEVERDIRRIDLLLKVCEIKQQRIFKEKGIKTVKEQEQLTREAMLDVRTKLEGYKEIRDKLRVKRTILECIIRRGEGI